MTSQYVLPFSFYNPNRHSSLHQTCSITGNHQRFPSKCPGKLLRLNKGARAYSLNSDSRNKPVIKSARPGSVSFYGLTHQIIQGGKSESSHFNHNSGSLLWLGGCVVLILSYILPPVLFGGLFNLIITDVTIAEIVVSLSSESAFYAGVAAFLIITDRVQRLYLDLSHKKWSLITDLRGYSLSVFIATCLKIVVPVFSVYISWSELGVDGLITVAPFLLGCLAQLMFENSLRIRRSSCWPLVPIIFEMYRIYQINRAVYFIERLVYAMSDLPKSPHLMERGDALVGMVLMLQTLGLVCLWSLITFLVTLFPCTPVDDK